MIVQPLLVALSVGGGFALIGTVAQTFATAYTNRVANRLAANRLSLDTEEARRKADSEERKILRDERDDYHTKWQAAEARADAAETTLRLMRHRCAALGRPCEIREADESGEAAEVPALPVIVSIHRRHKQI